MARLNISSGAPWEATVGYSRAVRVGSIVEVAGTTAVDGPSIIAEGHAYGQAMYIFERIGRALAETGAGLHHIVRTRMYVTSSYIIDDVLKAHGEIFSTIRPVATIVVVSALIDPRLLVEIEASAIVE